MNQNQIGRTVFDIDEESDAFFFQKAIEYHEWLLQQEAQPRLTRTPIIRDREDAERRLRANYFDDQLAWHSQYGRGDKKYPTIMLKAVASQDLWIWHAFFGIAGANNDINVLDNSPLFDDLLDDLAHSVPYVVNGVEYRYGYYLADGIYPEPSPPATTSVWLSSKVNSVMLVLRLIGGPGLLPNIMVLKWYFRERRGVKSRV
nr:hypothetical protein [Tanacetum cinerariifolium]